MDTLTIIITATITIMHISTMATMTSTTRRTDTITITTITVTTPTINNTNHVSSSHQHVVKHLGALFMHSQRCPVHQRRRHSGAIAVCCERTRALMCLGRVL